MSDNGKPTGEGANSASGFSFARKAKDLPDFAFLGPFLAEAEEKSLAAVVAVSAADPEAAKRAAKRRHDIKGALRTLGFSVTALQSGYRFDDDKAEAKITAIAKAVAVLTRESELALALLGESC